MATLEQYAEKIKTRWYGNESLARAAVTRSKLSKPAKDKLYALIEQHWVTNGKSNGAEELLKPGPTHVENDSLHKLALRVTLYAMDHGKPVNEVLAEIHTIIRNA